MNERRSRSSRNKRTGSAVQTKTIVGHDPIKEGVASGIPKWAVLVPCIAATITAFGAIGVEVVKDDGVPQSPAQSGISLASTTTLKPSPNVVADAVLSATVNLNSEHTEDPRTLSAFVLPAGAVAPDKIPPRIEGITDFVTRGGGVPVGSHSVGLQLRPAPAASGKTVVIRSIEPRIVDRRTAQRGAILRAWAGCGGGALREVDFDFDRAPPGVEYRSGESLTGEAEPLVLTVADDDPEVVAVTAFSTQALTYFIVIRYELDGILGKIEIGNAGRPFEIAASVPGEPVYAYSDEFGAVRQPDLDANPLRGC